MYAVLYIGTWTLVVYLAAFVLRLLKTVRFGLIDYWCCQERKAVERRLQERVNGLVSRRKQESFEIRSSN